MILNPRPSKISFFKLLFQILKDVEPYKNILDCASAGAKNRKLFKDKDYYGVDINAALIEQAKKDYVSDPGAHFYKDDALNFSSELKDMGFDLVISTHTLSWFTIDQKSIVLKNLTDRVNEGGTFILQCTASEIEFIQEVVKNFRTYKIFPYRVFLVNGMKSF